MGFKTLSETINWFKNFEKSTAKNRLKIELKKSLDDFSVDVKSWLALRTSEGIFILLGWCIILFEKISAKSARGPEGTRNDEFFVAELNIVLLIIDIRTLSFRQVDLSSAGISSSHLAMKLLASTET